MSKAQRPTIYEVARAAGVSISSVSRVLNGNTSNSDMIERVQAAVAEVGYIPSAVAQSLTTRQTGQIAFAMEDIGNEAYLEMVRAIQPMLREAGYRLLLHSTGADVSDEIDVLQSLGQAYVDGLILCPIRVTDRHLEALQRPPVPVVVIGSLPDGATVDNVRADSRKGACLAMKHLAEAGCRRIGFVNGPADTVPGQRRLAGYCEGLAAAGLSYDDALVAEADDFRFDAGGAATHELLKRGDVDGILGANDQIALGAMHALRESGRRVPDDVRVIGMDDTILARTSYPTLTSVDLGSAERGGKAAELLLARLKGDRSDPAKVTIPPSLSVRESTR
jgi:LacI family transcriptional regulator